MKAVTLGRLALYLVALCIGTGANAQSFPNKPVRVIVGYGAGGLSDLAQRIVAEQAAKRLGQPIVIDNRPGASSLLAAQAVRTATPDGYTLLGGSATIFSPVYLANGMLASKELSPVATIAMGEWFIFVPTAIGVTSIKELIAWAKGNPGKLRFAAPGVSNQMLMAVITKRLGIDFENIPYKTTDQTIAALVNGDAQTTMNGMSGFSPLVQAGKLRAIVTLAPQRVGIMPDVATATEQGLPLVLRSNHGLWAPLGTPRDAVTKLNAAVNAALKEPGVIDKLNTQSLVAVQTTPEEMIKTFESEMAFYTEAASLIGFKPQ